jgi:hypothetical protein
MLKPVRGFKFAARSSVQVELQPSTLQLAWGLCCFALIKLYDKQSASSDDVLHDVIIQGTVRAGTSQSHTKAV